VPASGLFLYNFWASLDGIPSVSIYSSQSFIGMSLKVYNVVYKHVCSVRGHLNMQKKIRMWSTMWHCFFFVACLIYAIQLENPTKFCSRLVFKLIIVPKAWMCNLACCYMSFIISVGWDYMDNGS
jgi:hypothetical protein